MVTSWRLAARLEQIEKGLKNRRDITFNHIKREENMIADILTNIGVHHDQTLRSGSFNILNDSTQLQECTDLVHKEAKIPDVDVYNN